MSQAAERYALALFEVSQKHGVTEQVEQDLREIKQVFQDNPELHKLLASPKLTQERTKNLVTELFGGAQPYLLNTLQLVGERKRLKEVGSIADEFIKRSNDAKGIEDAKVYSIRPLTEEETASISTAFAKKIGKQSLRIENIIDPSLIGGLRLQIGNRIFDSSVSSKLERLQRQLIG